MASTVAPHGHTVVPRASMRRECAWTSAVRDPCWSRPDPSDPPAPLGGDGGRGLEVWVVELPGVEPGSRGPDDEGATCVGPGWSRTRCSGARQPPRPHHAAVSPRATWSEPFGWIPVMAIDPPYGASEGDRRCVSGSEGQVSVLGVYWFSRGISEARVSILGTLPHRRQRPRSRPCQPPGRSIDAVRLSRCSPVRVPVVSDAASARGPSPARRPAWPSCGACRRRSCPARRRTRAWRARP